MVTVVRTFSDGSMTREAMSPRDAMLSLMVGPTNGSSVVSAHVEDPLGLMRGFENMAYGQKMDEWYL